MIYGSSNVLHEVYFGKSPGLIKAETVLDQYRHKYMNSYRDPKCLSDPLLKEYCRIMESEFGFGCFVMEVELSGIQNAMTLPVSSSIDIAPQCRVKKNLIVDKSGYKYNKQADYYFYMITYSGILFNPMYTTEEVQAIIMHEIGHNFYTVATTGGYYLTDIFFIFRILYAIISNVVVGRVDQAVKNALSVITATNVAKKVNKVVSDVIEDCPPLAVMGAVVKLIKGVSTDLTINLSTVLGWLTGYGMMPIRIISNLIGSLVNPTGYANEKFADNFATMYGYGPALVNALKKMEEGDQGVELNKLKNSNVVFQFINYYWIAPIEVLSSIYDEHPIYVERLKDQQRYLERELSKKDIDPRMKKKLQQNAKDVTNIAEDYLRIVNKADQEQMKDFKREYGIMMNALYGGDDRHHNNLVARNLAGDIDKVYDNVKLR